MTKKLAKNWQERQHKDYYVKKVRRTHYRSRAVYKLEEIDQQNQLIKKNYRIVDIGAAPGSWSQYASEKVGAKGIVIGIDILPIKPIHGAFFILGDLLDQDVLKNCIQHIGNQGADLVISDISPNITGIRVTDQAKVLVLAEQVLNFCQQVLKPGGHLLIKLFEGEGIKEYRQQLKQYFTKILIRKPGASRNYSREFYILAHSYKL